MPSLLSKLLSFSTSTREKQRDYQNVVIAQILIVGLGILLSEPVLKDHTTFTSKVIISIFSGFGLAYLFLLWDLLRNFTKSKWLIFTIFIVLAGVGLIGTTVEFPFYQLIRVPDRQLFLLVIHSILFPVEIIVISFAIRDIFMGNFLTPDKLWGSACVFLMIGISFGSLYDLICIARPGGLGVPIEMGFPNYSVCIAFSFSILGGIDPGYPDAIKLIRNISVLEAVWGNLFTVLIIGKLMGLPRKEN
jgi:hypothetical protein